jgi:hypothetical protein
MLPTLKPHEKMEIIADQNGKPGIILISRQSRMVVGDQEIKHVRFKDKE